MFCLETKIMSSNPDPKEKLGNKITVLAKKKVEPRQLKKNNRNINNKKLKFCTKIKFLNFFSVATRWSPRRASSASSSTSTQWSPAYALPPGSSTSQEPIRLKHFYFIIFFVSIIQLHSK